VEDHASFRNAMALLLEREGMKVIGQAGTLVEARRLLSSDTHVAVVDLGLPEEIEKDFF
jgi:DNA-binding NarL/FixJ family response regulator